MAKQKQQENTINHFNILRVKKKKGFPKIHDLRDWDIHETVVKGLDDRSDEIVWIPIHNILEMWEIEDDDSI